MPAGGSLCFPLASLGLPNMKTYQIDYFIDGRWTPGLIVKMLAKHLKYYLDFLNGDRPLIDARSGRKIYRKEHRCRPMRICRR